jgi:hypothetical protein
MCSLRGYYTEKILRVPALLIVCRHRAQMFEGTGVSQTTLEKSFWLSEPLDAGRSPLEPVVSVPCRLIGQMAAARTTSEFELDFVVNYPAVVQQYYRITIQNYLASFDQRKQQLRLNIRSHLSSSVSF